MKIRLRGWAPADAKDFWKYADNPKITANMRDSFSSTWEETIALASNFAAMDGNRACLRVIEVDGSFAGIAAVFLRSDVYRKSAEIAYWIGEPFWGKGIMTNAVCEICKTAFEAYDLVRICAEPFAYNTGSRRVLEKAGFMLEGTMKKSVLKNGKLFDSCLYALIR